MRNISVKLVLIWTSGRLKAFLIFGSGSPFIQPSRTIWAILVEAICEIILNLDQTSFKDISFVQPSKTTCAILAEGIMRNNSVKLF